MVYNQTLIVNYYVNFTSAVVYADYWTSGPLYNVQDASLWNISIGRNAAQFTSSAFALSWVSNGDVSFMLMYVTNAYASDEGEPFFSGVDESSLNWQRSSSGPIAVSYSGGLIFNTSAYVPGTY